MTDPNEVIDIRTPEVNVEAIMERIRERVQQRRAKAQEQGLVYDRLTESGSPIDSTGRRLSSDFYYDLYQARQGADSIWVSLSVVGNNRYPQILNSLITRFRHALHHLVIYYVNMLAGRQISFNRASIGAIEELARANELMAERLAALEKEVEILSERLAGYDGEASKGE